MTLTPLQGCSQLGHSAFSCFFGCTPLKPEHCCYFASSCLNAQSPVQWLRRLLQRHSPLQIRFRKNCWTTEHIDCLAKLASGALTRQDVVTKNW